MTKTCPNCSQLNLPEATFCHNCASPLAAAPAAAPPANQQPWPTPPQANPVVNQPAAAGAGASQRAIIALVLAGLSLVCCGALAGIPAAIVGWIELEAIKKGESPPAGKWMAQVGLWGGIGFTVLHIVIWVIYFLFAVMSSARY